MNNTTLRRKVHPWELNRDDEDPLFLTDFYKVGHHLMYPEDVRVIYTNQTPRKSRIAGVNSVVVFGLQYLIKHYLISAWNEFFFRQDFQDVAKRYKRLTDAALGPDSINTDHLKALHELGYLPLIIKALPEGSVCPIRVPYMTVRVSPDTPPGLAWINNYLESLSSCVLWQPITSATLAARVKRLLLAAAERTGGSQEFVNFQGHDFSFRGMSSPETAKTSGAGHLLSFVGTDTVSALPWLERYYNANIEKELVGCSVPATEHAVMCLRGEADEIQTFANLLDTFPRGILSVVSDTWRLTRVIGKILPALKEKIMARDGKLVIRPDSFWTTPADCLCGYAGYHPRMAELEDYERKIVAQGTVEALYHEFGGQTNGRGFVELDSHIGAIYGDSINYEAAGEISQRLEAKGFASTNVVLGMGSFGYQFNTRDTLGIAQKATASYHEASDGTFFRRDLFKDPITDDGMKKSARGLLRVDGTSGKYTLRDQVTEEEEAGGALEIIFQNGVLLKDRSLQEIRDRLANSPLV